MAAPKYNKQKPQLHCDHGNQVRESTAGFAVKMWTGKGQAERENNTEWGKWQNNAAEDFFHSTASECGS